MDAKVVNWWSFAAVSGLAFATVLIRSGWSERLADPLPLQMNGRYNAGLRTPGPCAHWCCRPGHHPRGIFGRNRRQTVSPCCTPWALYTLAVFIAAHLQSPRPTNAMVAAHLTIVMLSLVAGTLMCLQVQSIRARLRQQKRELESALVQIRDLAMRDELTGLFNRRQMSELMALELRRCERSGQPLLLAQLDIDLFKEINDTHGHTAGDRALKAFADVVSGELRSGDVLARWGGEEFVLLLSEARKSHAAELLERLRKSVECASIPGDGEDIGMTVSIGWTEHQRGEPPKPR
ncbi:MAG: GGDEF domain-containing protein [Simplicispira sp.]|nr:GGDEF domain-containing protein [Simplicispira sp.]